MTQPQPPTPDDYTEHDLRTMEACEELSRLVALWIHGHFYDYCGACEKPFVLEASKRDHDCPDTDRPIPVAIAPYSGDNSMGVVEMTDALGPHITIDRQGEDTDYLVEVQRNGEYLGASGPTLPVALAGACALCWHRGWEAYDE